MVPLTVEQGFPLEIVLTAPLRSRLNEPVHGRIMNPVYVFDREVIPSGTEILGKVTGLQSVGKWKRISSMLGGDFTPLHEPQIRFDTLVMADGTQIPIDTSAVLEGNVLLRFDKGRTRAFTTTTAPRPGKELLHSLLWSLSPYHPQTIATGATYKATLLQPLQFGNALLGTRALSSIGAEPEPGSLIYARLLTALDSKTTKRGTSVQAILTRPLYSLNHQLIFPAGSRIQGEVAEARGAGMWNRNGELTLKFTKIEPPLVVMTSMNQIREIQGRLVGLEVSADLTQLQIDQDGMTGIQRSKARFLAPAVALAGAGPMLNAGTASFGTAFAEAYSSSFINRISGGSAGLGLPAGVAGLMVPPLGLGLGAYGVSRSIYSNLIGHGKNITLPADTPIEIRLD